MRKRGELAEWAKVHSQDYYGTPRSYRGTADAAPRPEKDVLLDIDVQGALQVKRRFPGGGAHLYHDPELW